MAPESDNDSFGETRPFKTLSPGTVISHYKIIEKIAQGGMGVVYKAEDTRLGRVVALKFLPPHQLADEEAKVRLQHEARAASALNHPNIATIYEIDEAEGQSFIAMEYVDGKSIGEMTKDANLSLEDILGLCLQIAAGLSAAHEQGIIHRDIKSDNIMVTSKDLAKIMDFGLAKLKGATRVTKTGTTVGTLHYMSPEQAQGKELDGRSDIFSFGVVLYEMTAGRLPFKGDYEQAIVYSILNDRPEPLARYKANVPEGLQRIVDKALAKDKKERYQDTADLLADLRHEKRLLEAREPARVSPALLVRKFRKRMLRILIPAAVVVAAVLFLFIFEPFRIETGPRQEAAARENSLAIMYFENLADKTDPEMLGEIVTNLLITDLSESRYMSVVSGQRLYDTLKLLGKEGAKVVDRTVASEVATKAGTRWMLLGSILQVEPLIILTARLVEVESGRVEASQRVSGDEGEQIFTVVDRLAVEIRGDLSLPPAAQEEPDRPVAEVTTHSPDAYRYYLEGIDYFYSYSFAEAERSFEKALEFDSTFAMAYYAVAGATGDEDREKEMIARALEYSDKVSDRERYYINARAARMSRDYARAVEELEKLLERYPDEKPALENLAWFYDRLRKYDESIDCLNKVIEIDPLYKEAYNGLAYDYHRIGDFDKSVWAADKYVSLAPDEHNPYDTRGDIYAWNGRLDQALDSYSRALEIKPDFEPAIVKLGHLYLFKREYAKSEGLYQKLFTSTLKDVRSEGRVHLAYAAMYQGKFDEALGILDTGIMADRMERSDYWLAEKYLAKLEIYLKRKETGKAIEGYEEIEEVVSQHWPDRVTNWVNDHVGVLVESGEIGRAEEVAEAARKHFEADDKSGLFYYWTSIGFIERAKGNFGAALTNFEKVVAEVPFWWGARYLRARAYLESDSLGEAVTEFEYILSIYSSGRVASPIWSVKAHYLLGLAYEKSGWNTKAAEQYEEFLEIWKDADPGIPEIEDARQRLARLKPSS